MKSSFSACCIAVFVLLVVPWSAYTQDNKQGPRLVLPEKEFNFGDVGKGSRITHEFVVLNQGDASLEIKKVSPG